MSAPVLFHAESGVATITLNLPDRRNPISDPATIEALLQALARTNADRGIKVAILTGAGTTFSSGGDLRSLGAPGGLGGGAPAHTASQYTAGIQRVPLAFQALEVPIIAAVNGPAIGAGCDLACMCDIRIAAETARFAESFIKLGLIPGDGGAWLLPRLVGFSKACEMAFTGESMSAAEAVACGLVSRVVPDIELMPATYALAARIAVHSGDALRMTKRLLVRGRDCRLDELLELSAAMQALAHTTPEHQAFVAAFTAREGRKADDGAKHAV